jgi:hypothetical protein
MTNQDTSLLVFNESEQQPKEVERRRNGIASRWSITPASQQFMLDFLKGWKPSKPFRQLDHQGISSGLGPRDPTSGRFSDSAAETTIFYFDDGNWTKLGTLSLN